MLEMQGFSRIMECLLLHKKPMIGHNCLSDIIRIYHNFIDELPQSYKDFKKVIHELFPEVYDTKHMAYCSRRQLEDYDSLDLAGSMFVLMKQGIDLLRHIRLKFKKC